MPSAHADFANDAQLHFVAVFGPRAGVREHLLDHLAGGERLQAGGPHGLFLEDPDVARGSACVGVG
jgi:hypothetical protein